MSTSSGGDYRAQGEAAAGPAERPAVQDHEGGILLTPDRRRRTVARAFATLVAVVLLAACGASSQHTSNQSSKSASPSPRQGASATATPTQASSPPVDVSIATPTAHAVSTIPAATVAQAYTQSATLLSAMYTQTLSLTGSPALITALAGQVGETLTASPRTSVAAHPVFPPSAVTLGQFAVQRSAFSARQVRCDFAFCEGGGFAGERSVALVVHWSGAVRYPVTIRATGHAGTVAGRYEVDLYWIVRFIPSNPTFLGKQPGEPTTVTAGYLPVLAACVGKGLLVPPDPPPPLKPTDYGPPTSATSTGAPGRCPA